MSQWYDGTKLLSLQDINGEKPEIYICTSNRSGGKTTWWNRYACNRFFKYEEKFCLLYRYNYEIKDAADKFYKDISTLFFPGTYMTSMECADGKYQELFIDDKPCGYAIALNDADEIKKLSHLMSDTSRIIFDEFQSENNKYCTGEVRKFRSIHMSLARGQGKAARYLPVIMISNPVTIINPYYVSMGISTRLRDNTNFLRGNGFVLEQGYVDSAAEAQKTSAFNRAFGEDKYLAYATEGVYLNDSKAFIEKPKGRSVYLCTLRYDGTDYAVREFPEDGVVYCDDKADASFPTRLVVRCDDHRINYVMIKRNNFFLSNLRYYFEQGCFRFKDLRCKEVILTALSY